MLDNPEIGKALEEVEESAFTEEELLGYDHFWDMLGASRLLMIGSIRRGMKEGMKEGMEKGLEKGLEEGLKKGMEKGIAAGEQKERIKNARAMKESGIQTELISRITGLAPDEIASL